MILSFSIEKSKDNLAKRKEESIKMPSSHFVHSKLLCFDCDDFTAIVGAASLAGSVGQAGLTALGASDHAGDRQLPVGVTSLISSCLGNFSLGNCHFGTPPWLKCRIGILSTSLAVFAALPCADPILFCSHRDQNSNLFRIGNKVPYNLRCTAACCPCSGQLRW